MRFLYWLRKLIGVLLVIAWMTVYIILMFNGKEQYSTLMIILLLLIVLIGMSLYPKKQSYCSCGHKWYKKITLKETTESSKTDKKGNTKTTFVHTFDCTCKCPNCNKVMTYNIKADGGYNILKADGSKESHRIKSNIYMQNKDLLK